MAHTCIHTLHAVDEDRLRVVGEEMAERGAPTIRVLDCGDYYRAIEGTHRIVAAAELGLTPIVEVVDPETPMREIAGLDEGFVSDAQAAGEYNTISISDWVNQHPAHDGIMFDSIEEAE